MTSRVAVVLLNLGAPDRLSAVRPFLRNLFSDPAIIKIPNPFRLIFAHLMAQGRDKKAQKIYEQLGGGSPLLANTQSQQNHLQHLLSKEFPNQTVQVFIAMRYWHPFTEETVAEVKKFQPDEIILLPLYPQFSTTTTGSSFLEWHQQAHHQKLLVKAREIHSYPENPHFIEAHVDNLLPWIEKARSYGKPVILFSAHGLPQDVVDKGDPYEKQVHQTTRAILQKLSHHMISESEIDSTICYQSKVGYLKWLTPSLGEEIQRAGKRGKPVVVVPVSFVSEHSETLVELDVDYKKFADESGVPFYGRVPALGDHPAYIKALVNLTLGRES